MTERQYRCVLRVEIAGKVEGTICASRRGA